MCGIFAASRITDFTRPMLPILAWEMKKRGTDAWGASDGQSIVKRLGSITDSYHIPPDWEAVIAHTRAGTHGAKNEVENAHPFIFEHEGMKIIGVHNGVMRSHTELNAKYSRNFAVDSQHIYAHLIEHRNLAEIEGYGALVWWEGPSDNSRPMEMCLAKFNTYDLHACQLDTGEVVICSLYSPISESAPMFGAKIKQKYYLDDNTKYTIHTDGETDMDVVYKGITLPFGPARIQQSATMTNGTGYQRGRSGMEEWSHIYSGPSNNRGRGSTNSSFTPPWRSNKGGGESEDECFQCSRKLQKKGEELFCFACLHAMKQGWEKKTNASRTTSGNTGNSVHTD